MQIILLTFLLTVNALLVIFSIVDHKPVIIINYIASILVAFVLGIKVGENA